MRDSSLVLLSFHLICIHGFVFTLIFIRLIFTSPSVWMILTVGVVLEGCSMFHIRNKFSLNFSQREVCRTFSICYEWLSLLNGKFSRSLPPKLLSIICSYWKAWFIVYTLCSCNQMLYGLSLFTSERKL